MKHTKRQRMVRRGLQQASLVFLFGLCLWTCVYVLTSVYIELIHTSPTEMAVTWLSWF